MTGFTSAGLIFIGIVIGLIAGFKWGTIRERKGINKKKKSKRE